MDQQQLTEITNHFPFPKTGSIILLVGGALFEYLHKISHADINFYMGFGLFVCGYISYAVRLAKWLMRKTKKKI